MTETKRDVLTLPTSDTTPVAAPSPILGTSIPQAPVQHSNFEWIDEELYGQGAELPQNDDWTADDWIEIPHEHYIPISKSRIIAAFKTFPKAQEAGTLFDHFLEMVDGIYHFHYHKTLNELKEDYEYFAPDSGEVLRKKCSKSELIKRQNRFIANFIQTMGRGNFKPFSEKDYQLTVKHNYLFDLPIQINWDVHDPKMLADFHTQVAGSQDGELYQRMELEESLEDYLDFPEEFGTNVLIFHRGIERDQTDGTFIMQKVDILINRALGKFVSPFQWLIEKIRGDKPTTQPGDLLQGVAGLKDKALEAGIQAKDKALEAKDKALEVGTQARDKALEVGMQAKDKALEVTDKTTGVLSGKENEDVNAKIEARQEASQALQDDLRQTAEARQEAAEIRKEARQEAASERAAQTAAKAIQIASAEEEEAERNVIFKRRWLRRKNLGNQQVNLKLLTKKMKLQEPTLQRVISLFRMLPPQPPKLLDKVPLLRRFFPKKESPEVDWTIHLKMFKHIPLADIEMIFPEKHVKMKSFDVTMLCLTGLTGLFAVYRGLQKGGKLAIIMMSVLGLYIVKVITGYRRVRANYMARITRDLYHKNLDNNVGVIQYLVDTLEEQEFKEAVLVYFVLWNEGKAMSEEEIDGKAELFLQQHFDGIEIDFEVDDALDKVIVREDDSRKHLPIVDVIQTAQGILYKAKPIEEALRVMDEKWDNFYEYNL